MNQYDMPEEQMQYSHEAECSVIGAVLMQGSDAFDSACLDSDHFYLSLHQLLWTELKNLVLAGKHVDLISLMEVMRGADVDWAGVNEMTGIGYMSARAVSRHGEIIRGHAKARALKSAARAVVGIAADESSSIEQRVSQAVAELEAVIEEKVEQEVRPVADFATDFIDRLQSLADGETVAARPTHIPTLDKLLAGGLRDEQLVIVAARPSVGKSSFAQQLELTCAQDGIPAAFFGMEMTSREITNRTVANLGRVPLSGIKTGQLDNEGWDRVIEGVEALRTLPLWLYDQPAMTLTEVASKTRKLVRKSGVKLVVVDYLQLMKGSNRKGQDRRVELEEITRGMKQLAKQLGITVVLLSQLNRAVEQRSNPRPVMSDLKECGAIEEDADVILALWTHSKGEEGTGDLKGCAVLKNRDGQTGEVALHFDGQYQRWTESTASLNAPLTKPAAKPAGRGMDSWERSTRDHQ
jgi:replicative DNA helicase